MISGPLVFFFFQRPGGQDIVPILNALQDVFFLSSFPCWIFFPQKSVVFTFTECIYIYIVDIVVIVLRADLHGTTLSHTKNLRQAYDRSTTS